METGKKVMIGSVIVVLLVIGGFLLYNFSNKDEESQQGMPVPGEDVEETIVEALSFSWEEDSGQRISDGSVPFIHALSDGKTRLYYCNSDGILSAISNDGMAFTKEQGTRISPGTGFETVVCDP